MVHAARATRKATKPEASLSKPSPFRMLEIRFGKVKRSEREAKATKSVGPSAAPTAIQAASGIPSHKRWANHPKLRVEIKITGKIKKAIMRQCFRIEVMSASSASRKRSGPITKAKKSSVSRWYSELGKRKPIPIPNNIWIKGRGKVGINLLVALETIRIKEKTMAYTRISIPYPPDRWLQQSSKSCFCSWIF